MSIIPKTHRNLRVPRVLVENCVSKGHAGLGLHPGSGSQRTVIRGNRNRIENNRLIHNGGEDGAAVDEGTANAGGEGGAQPGK